jgi:hypothetical protein
MDDNISGFEKFISELSHPILKTEKAIDSEKQTKPVGEAATAIERPREDIDMLLKRGDTIEAEVYPINSQVCRLFFNDLHGKLVATMQSHVCPRHQQSEVQTRLKAQL